MKKQITTIYLICVHVFLVVVLIKSDFIDRVERKFGMNQNVRPPEITEHYHRMIDYHRRMDGNVPEGAVIFIGDSITQGLCVAAIAPTAVNYGIGGDTTRGVLQRLPDYKSIERARAIVLAIGINDMKRQSNDKILENYCAIISQIPKTTPIIVSAVLPLDEEVVNDWKGWNQERIKDLNSKLERFITLDDNVVFVNSGPLLIDESGNLADGYHDGDGVHLNSKGNAVWIKELKKTIEKVQPN